MLTKLVLTALVLAVAVALIPASPMPAMAADVLVIVPGDILSITVLGEPELTRRVVVDAHGKITLPMANEVEVGGVAPAEAAGRIKSALLKFIKIPQVTVEVAEPAKRLVVVSGAVKTPGIYDIGPDTTLMAILSKAGGYTPDADLGRVTVTRGTQRDSAIHCDLTGFLAGTKPEANINIEAGDTIVIPEKNPVEGMVFVLGEVNSRGQFPMRQGMTFREAIASSGGPTALANTDGVIIRHKNGGADIPVDYNKAVIGDPVANMVLEVGDTIVVPAKEIKGTFTIFGPVVRPGQYPVVANMNISDAIVAAGGTTELGNLNKVQLTRALPTGKTQSIKIDVPKIMEGKATNVAIQPGDTIRVSEKRAPVDKLRALGLLGTLLLLL